MCIYGYLITKTHLINLKDEELGLKTRIRPAKIGIDFYKVSAWRESVDDDMIPDGTIVYCGADSFYIETSFQEFTELFTRFKDSL